MGGKSEQLRSLTSQQIRKSIQGIKNLGVLLNDAVVDHPEDQLPDMIAALHQVEVLSSGVRKVMESQGVVIFSRNGLAGDTSLTALVPTEPSLVPVPGEPTGVPEDEAKQPAPEKDLDRPKTFGELLTRRIDIELLSEERTTFTSQELYGIFGSTFGAKKAIREEGLSLKQKEITREEAIRVITRYLITPEGHFKPKQSYDRTRFIIPNLKLHAGDLNRWSEEIGHSWIQNPKVDHETAMQIRGLAALNKLLDKRK